MCGSPPVADSLELLSYSDFLLSIIHINLLHSYLCGICG